MMVGSAHGRIIFRIYGYDVHGIEKLHRRPAGDPGNRFLLGGFGFKIIIGQEFFHLFESCKFGHILSSPEFRKKR